MVKGYSFKSAGTMSLGANLLSVLYQVIFSLLL